MEVFQQRIVMLAAAARGVGILDAQHENAARPHGVEGAEQRRARVAEMQSARRAGSEAGTDHGALGYRHGRWHGNFRTAAACPACKKPSWTVS